MMGTVLESLNASLHEVMESDARVHILGEDILDPYGGAFKVTRGLSTRFPDRVLTTPISEAGIVGMATGMALRGLRPVVEIMFGDFVTLIADQLINHAAKFRWMYNDQVRVPLVVRTPMGGRRGYGPTHSQSLEKLFLGVPGLTVVAHSTLGDPGTLLQASIACEDPVLFVEHKLLYARPLLHPGEGELGEFEIQQVGDRFPAYVLHIPGQSPRLTLATYGYNFELARLAALRLLMEQEIFVDLVVFSQLSPFELDPLFASLAQTKNLLTIEEGSLSLGWGAEVVARAVTALSSPSGLRAARVAGRNLPIANARPMEDATLPSVETILQAALSLLS